MKQTRLSFRWGALAIAVAGAGCATSGAVGMRPVEAQQARNEVPEAARLDIAVHEFDPGIPEGSVFELTEKGIFPDVRRSEGRFMAVHLKSTLEQTGQWGAVRVVPGAPEGAELIVRGRILLSNGRRLELEIAAHDATGRRWLERTYSGEADPMAYAEEQVDVLEPYQSLYNEIANDLLEFRGNLWAGELREVRDVAELRFATDLAPEAFAAYVEQDQPGHWSLTRLPAEGDPMLGRVRDIRERDAAFVDTLNGHYALFYDNMDGPYDDWRMYSYVEQKALDDLGKSSKIKRVLGGLAILSVLFVGGESNSADLARQIAILGGIAAIRAGNQDASEAGMHRAALGELAASLEGDLEPILVDVEGQTARLTGSAVAQFAEWRNLLRRLFASETGLPIDPNAPEAQPAGGSAGS